MFYGYANVPILLSFRAQIEWLVMLPPVFVFTCRWPNTVFSRAFADAIQHVHKDRKNKHAVVTAIIFFVLNARSAFAIFHMQCVDGFTLL